MTTIRYIDVYGVERSAEFIERVSGLVPWRKVEGEIQYSQAARYLIEGKITQVPDDAWEFVDVLGNSPVNYENWDLLDHL